MRIDEGLCCATWFFTWTIKAQFTHFKRTSSVHSSWFKFWTNFAFPKLNSAMCQLPLFTLAFNSLFFFCRSSFLLFFLFVLHFSTSTPPFFTSARKPVQWKPQTCGSDQAAGVVCQIVGSQTDVCKLFSKLFTECCSVHQWFGWSPSCPEGLQYNHVEPYLY